MDKQISVSEAARMLGITLDGVYRLLYAGKLQGVKADGKWRIPVDAVEVRLRARVG